ncbi:MAG: DUF4390 domain-containing protein [Gammaproteobacteria bacterium]|jgi:hypothetical protein
MTAMITGCRAINRVSANWFALMALIVGILPRAGAAAANEEPEFVIRSAGTVLVDKVYQLNARIHYRFSDEALDALDNGVPLVVELAIEIERKRDYVWDETVASLHQRYQLSYEALTQRYVVTNLNSGADNYYGSRAAAIAALGDVNHLPILDAGLLNPDEKYTVSLQASLDLDALPVPMRVIGYFSSNWRIASEWVSWPLQ